MHDLDAHREIGELKARCDILSARLAALTAFTCAILESNPRKDELQTRWAKHLGPAIEHFSKLDDVGVKFSASVPAWVATRLGDGLPGE